MTFKCLTLSVFAAIFDPKQTGQRRALPTAPPQVPIPAAVQLIKQFVRLHATPPKTGVAHIVTQVHTAAVSKTATFKHNFAFS